MHDDINDKGLLVFKLFHVEWLLAIDVCSCRLGVAYVEHDITEFQAFVSQQESRSGVFLQEDEISHVEDTI